MTLDADMLEPKDFGIPLARAAIYLDIDGTIIDIANEPNGVHVPSELLQVLAKLRDETSGATAFVTGRRIDNVDGLFTPFRSAAIGCHGAEFRARAGDEIERGAPLPDFVRSWARDLEALALGVFVEDKGTSLAVHYRLAPDAEQRLAQAVSELKPYLQPAGLHVLRGKQFFEIKPRWHNKGTALRRMMNVAPFAGRVPVFLGDDVTDEDVFRVLPEFDGIGFSVGRRIEGAAYGFESPRAVRRFLRHVAIGA